MTALAATGCLLLSACTSSSEPGETSASANGSASVGSTPTSESSEGSGSGASAASGGAGGIASASPTTIPAPEESDDVRGVEVELSSSTSSAGEPVQVTVVVPKKLAGESVVLVTAADDGSWDVITAPVMVNEDLAAYMTLDMGRTLTFRAVVPKADVSDAVSLPADAPILGQSEDFTITVE